MASKLQVYGIGIVAANKPLSSKLIEVTPIEDLTMLDGEITDNMVDVTTKGQSSSGGSYESSVATTVTVTAEWLPVGISNRVTPPDVRRGEHVVLYRFADVDKYYWTTLQYDMKLRKLETVIYAFSNTRDESADGSVDTTYFLEISTHRKVIHLHTSKSDGEPFVYDLQLNTKDGVFTFQDDIGNYIQLDSKNVRIEMKNADGTTIDLNRRVLNLYAPEDINVNAGNNINIAAANTINTNATTFNSAASQSNHQGNISVTGGDMLVEGISATRHRHIEQGDGAPVSPPIP